MKKLVKKGAAVLMILILVLAMAACGSKDPTGHYDGKLDAKEMMTKMMAEAGLEDYEFKGDLTADITLDLNKDNTFTMTMDGEGLIASMQEFMKNNGKDMINSMMEAQGYTQEDMESLSQLAGYGSYDEMVDVMLDEMSASMSESFTEGMDSTSVSGTYTIDGKNLKMENEEGTALGVDSCVINDDGTISMNAKMNEQDVVIVFKKA